MDRPVLLDTDVLVDFLRGRSEAVAFLSSLSGKMILSAIVVAELHAGVRGNDERAALDELLSLFRVVPVTDEIARAGGLLKRDYGGSHGVSLGDAINAATALSEKADLRTLNVKHYPMLSGLKPAYARA